MIVHKDPQLGERERREALHRGQLVQIGVRPATRALASWVWERLRAVFHEADPRAVQFRIPNEEFFARLTALRQELLLEPRIKPLIRDLLDALGCDLEGTYFDLLRLRAVTSGGHRIAAAANAYHVHRDTWYANPAAQVNVWIAVKDTSEDECFAFYPDCYGRPIKNSSALFDYGDWLALGGWQVPNERKVYPTVEEEVRSPRFKVPCREAEGLLFSGSQLHGTTGHDAGRTRFSLEVRTVHIDDVLPLFARRNLDNRSRGTTLGDYFRGSDFAPFPEELRREYLALLDRATAVTR